VEEAVARLQISVDVVGGMQICQPGSDVLEQGVNLFWEQPFLDLWSLRLAPGPAAHLSLELFLGRLLWYLANDILQEVASVAILLKDKGACDAGAEAGELDVFQPDVAV
jgi:hypothetical protein